ncbi:MAG: hypothetical protein WC807_19055 [Hyphomicrobium sp.]
MCGAALGAGGALADPSASAYHAGGIYEARPPLRDDGARLPVTAPEGGKVSCVDGCGAGR